MALKEKKAQVHAENSSDSELVRRFKTNPLVFIGTVVVLVIVVVAFVLVPAIAPSGQGRADLTFGSYDKIPISYVPGNYFARYYEMLSQFRRNQGDVNYDQFADYQLWQESFQAAALNTAVLQEMKQTGYTAPEKVVDREVAQMYQENGRFSRALYDSVDSNTRLAQWRQTQTDIAARHFYSDLGSLAKPAAAAAFMGKIASPQRTFEMACFPIADDPNTEAIEGYPNTELAAYGKENANLFRTIHLSKILVTASEREARQILASIKDGTTTFEDAAKVHSKDSVSAEKGGDMGIKAVYELTAEIPDEAAREKVIALAKGEYSDVIEVAIEDGEIVNEMWVFFRAEEAAASADFADAAALGRVRAYMREFERGRMDNWALEQARDFIALVNESDFTNAAAAKNTVRRGFGPLPLNYGDVDLFARLSASQIPELYSAVADENFWKTAFSTPVNSPSEPLVQGGNVLVLFPTSETDVETSAVESLESAYASYWLAGTLERSLSTYFMNNGKMEDRFMETFFRYMMPQTN